MSAETRDDPASRRATIVLDLGSGGDGWIQRLADLELWCDRPLPADSRPAARPEIASAPADPDRGELVYDGPGSVTGRLERVRAWRSPAGFRTVEFERGEGFRVFPGGGRIEALAPVVPGDARSLELALGAPLALALAICGVHLLHASAIVAGGAVVALTGPSGAGKSTLAAAAARSSRWRRAADDILPVRLDEASRALPAFPQLKLAPAEGWPKEGAPALPLAALVEIEHADRVGTARLERLHGGEALRVLIAATVAARLYDEALLVSHLERAGSAAGALWIGRLHYASGGRGLAAALELLEPLALRSGPREVLP